MTAKWRGARSLDRDILAEKVATMSRKGQLAPAICAEFGISKQALRELANDYGFRFPGPEPRSSAWPKSGDPGEPAPRASAYQNWERAVEGAAATRRMLEASK